MGVNFQLEEHVIQNSDGEDVNLRYTSGESGYPLIIKIHGLASGTTTPHNEEMAFSIRNLKFPVLDIDATNSNSNLSGGSLDQFTMDRHVSDLRDALDWLKENKPELVEHGVALAGHSMGGYAVLNLASQMTDDIDFVISFSPVISGEKLKKAWEVAEPEAMAEWKNGQPYVEPEALPLSVEGRLPWGLWAEWEQHDLGAGQSRDSLTMPIAFIVGENDALTTARDVEEFARSLPLPHKQNMIRIIPGADHCFKDEEGKVQDRELAEALSVFIGGLYPDKKVDHSLQV